MIHIFLVGSNNENELQYLVHFIHPEFLEIYYYSTKFRVQKFNSGIKKKHLSIIYKDPSVPTRRILHTIGTQAVPAMGVNKP